MRFIHVGVSGFGGVWCRVLAESRRARVVGLVDVKRAHLREACRRGGYDPAICFGSLGEALARVEADAVVCSTPPATHRAILIEAMEAGLHGIVEKPLADTPADCRRLQRAAERTGRTLVVSQNYRYNPFAATVAALTARRAIGRIGQVTLDFHKGVVPRGFRREMPYPLLVDMAVHHFDLMRYLTGAEPVCLKGEAWNPPWSLTRGDASSTLVIEMRGGARIVYDASWATPGDFCDWNGNWRIEGTRGTLVYGNGTLMQIGTDRRLRVRSRRRLRLRKRAGLTQACVLQDFIKAVKSGARAMTDVADNVRTMEMVFAAVRAVRTGRAVRLG
ncbi:MAG: Gfo/Idh/MocA family oxidoreductase [Lentisphaerae bacterium]|nr:Gfo/Idh/MocA family oxidoreductase [Lentisphaerota bacterium]